MKARHSALRFLLAAMLIFSTSACTSKPNDSIPPHIGPAGPSGNSEKSGFQTAAEVREQLYSLEIDSLIASVETFDIKQHREESFIPLRKLFLNVEFLENPYKENIEHEIPKALWAFQYSAIRIIDSEVGSDGKLSETGRRLLSEIMSYYTYGCAETEWKGCHFYEFFAKDSQTSEIVKRFVKYMDLSVEEYYRYIKLAYKPHSHRADPELESLIMARSLENIRRFVRIEYSGDACKSVELNTIDFTFDRKRELGTFLSFVSQVIETGANRKSVALNKEMVKELFLWLQSGKTESVLGSHFSHSITKLITAQLKSDILWNEFSNSLDCREKFGLEEIVAKTLDPEPVGQSNLQQVGSYAAAVWHTNNIDPSIFSEMKVVPIELDKLTDKDDRIYYFIAAELFAIKSAEEILPYWNATAKDVVRMMEIMENFMRVYMLNNTVVTNQTMATIFRSELRFKLHPSEFMTQIRYLAESKVTPMWLEFHRGVKNMKAFFEGHIDSKSGEQLDEATRLAIQKTRDFYNHINLNIKYLATYPNILMFAYFAKILKYKERFYIWFFDDFLTVDANIVLQEYLKGNLPPLFLFTNYDGDDEPIDSVEVMYSVYFAIKLNLFEQYGVSPVDWFKRFVDAYLLPKKEVLRTWAKKVRKSMEDHSSYAKYMEICDAVKVHNDGRPVAIRPITRLSPREVLQRTFHGRLGARANFGTFGHVLATNGKFDIAIAEANEIIRSDVDPRLNTIMLLRSLIAKEFETARDNDEIVHTKNDVLKKIDAEIALIKDLRKQIYDDSVILERDVSDCLLTLDREEHIRQIDVHKMERAFTRQVYIGLSALNDLDQEGKTVGQVKEENPEHIIWTSPLFAQMVPERDLLSEVNRLLLESAHYPKTFELIKGYNENFGEGLIGRHTSGAYFYNFRGNDTAIRILNFLKYGYMGMERSLTVDRIEAILPNDYKEFFRSFVNWQNDITRWNKKIDYLPSRSMSFEENLLGFETSTMLHLISDKLFRQWTDYFDDNFQVVRASRRLIQSRVQMFRMKYEMEIDPSVRASCEAECHRQKTERMKEDSKYILDLMKRLVSHTTLGGISDYDFEILKLFDVSGFYSGGFKMPLYLFMEMDRRFHRIYMPLAEDPYTMLTAYHLGKHASFRQIRKGAEEDITDAPANDGPGADLNAIFFSRINYWQEAKKYFETFDKQDEELLLEIDSEVLAYIRHSVTWRISEEMRMVGAFEEAVKEYHAEEMEGVPPLLFNTFDEPYKHDSLLRTYTRTQYHSLIRDFNDTTLGIYLPEEFQENFDWVTTE